MIDITDAKGNIRPEFMHLSQEEWVALYHQGRLPSGINPSSVIVDRVGDLVSPAELTMQVNQQRTDMPAPMAPLAAFTVVQPQPKLQDNLGAFGSIGLITVQALGVDNVPLFLGIATILIPLLFMML
jgi:hypothetical protein